MNIFQRAKKLVQEKLIMFRSKIIIFLNYSVKVIFHQLKNNINIFKFSWRRRKHYMFYLHNIWMVKQPKEFNFSQNTRGIRNMLKDITNLLDCHPLPSAGVNCRPNYTIASLANDLLNLVLTGLAIFGEEFFVKRVLSEITRMSITFQNAVR